MDISNQLNQKFFGRKELEILNQKPKPPSIKSIRKPSNVDENYNNDTGVVGYMGNDEDLESIKYDIMDNMNQKMNNFDDRIEKLLNQIQKMDSNRSELERLRENQDSLASEIEAQIAVSDHGNEAYMVDAILEQTGNEGGSGNIEHMLEIAASARPCSVLSRAQYTRNRIDTGEDPLCTRFYRRGSGEDGVVESYLKYDDGNKQYGRSCGAYYHESVNTPIVEDPPNYCKDYNGKVAQKCNTIIGYPSPSPGANCVELNSTTNRDQQLWVDKCSQYLGEGPCNASEDCIYRKIGNEEKCIFNCEKLNTSLGQGNISDDVKCKKDKDGHYESTDIVPSDSLDTSDNSVLQDYCEQFISQETCDSDKCLWDNDLHVLGYDFKCIPQGDSTTCNLSDSFKQLLRDSGEECKSLTSSPCCDVFSEVCSYENETCSSSLSLSFPVDPRYYNNHWRLGDYIFTLLFSIVCVFAFFYKNPVKKIYYIVLPLLFIVLNIGKISLSVLIEKKYDFINIGKKPTLSYWLFVVITNVLLLVILQILSWRLKGDRRDADGVDSSDGSADGEGIDTKGKIILRFFIIFVLLGILGFFYSVYTLYNTEVKEKICDTATEYNANNKINEYCKSINESYDRTPEYNIAYGDNDKEFTNKCKFPCKKYSENADLQRVAPLITCFAIMGFSLFGTFKMEGILKILCIITFIVPIILILWANFFDHPVCKAKNKDDSDTCNSITNLDICKAALHRDGGADKDNEDKNICFLYHGPFWTYFSGEYIGSGLKVIIAGVLAILLVFVVSFVITGDVPQGFKKVKAWKQGLGTG